MSIHTGMLHKMAFEKKKKSGSMKVGFPCGFCKCECTDFNHWIKHYSGDHDRAYKMCNDKLEAFLNNFKIDKTQSDFKSHMFIRT